MPQKWIAVVNEKPDTRFEIRRLLSAIPNLSIVEAANKQDLNKFVAQLRLNEVFDIVITNLGNHRDAQFDRQVMFSQIGRNAKVKSIIIFSEDLSIRPTVVEPRSLADRKIVAAVSSKEDLLSAVTKALDPQIPSTAK